MNKELLERLSVISPEESELLNGREYVDRTIYSDRRDFVVDSKKLLADGGLIQLRTHTRFVHFPKHTHNFVEITYMCSGATTHIINGVQLTLNTGEILILSQSAEQEILPAGKGDIALNFIIRPEFFEKSLIMLGGSLIRDFLVDCLRTNQTSTPYLHFKAADIHPVQNLIENLAYSIVNKIHDNNIDQITMGLLLLHLMNNMDTADLGLSSYDNKVLLSVLRFIDENYKDGRLCELSKSLSIPVSHLSRLIKSLTGSTYTQLLQTKRLNHAKLLLETTNMSVLDISLAVGYDNFSYFYRLFKSVYGLSPKKYLSQKNI